MAVLITDVTTGVIDGNGSFDKLMTVAKAHLLEEYTKQRITGDSYAQAYIATMQAAMQAAIQFTISAEQTNNQSELTDEQKQLIIAQTAQVKAETLNVPKQGLLLDVNKLNVEQDTLYKTAQRSLTEKQEDLVDKQILTETAQTTNPISGIKKAEWERLQKDIELTDTNIRLVSQKVETELSQVSDVTTQGNTIAGVVGKQKAIYEAQAKGFKDDAITKATKMMIDVFSVQRSTDDAFAPPTALDNVAISTQVTKMLTQVNT